MYPPLVKAEPASLGQQREAVQVLEVTPLSSPTPAPHPYAFHISGPRNVASPNWRDLISSSWKDDNYKRTVIACFIQAVYLLELDRQENRTLEDALAPSWTLLKGPTMRRDIEDDLRFLAWESLKGSVRFNVALQALRSVAERYGASNVCVAGHSLGADLALVGKALAKEAIFVDAHLFNPPSVSLAMSFRNMGEKAEFAWKRLKAMRVLLA
ncbi:unnamed protein product [Linum tenue]|uniref:GDSL esterase/lipase n=1 Tax=Linum tenue TaxID=586396 RepID=A0AAV0MT50_9ROSI|nr:unnamed protein product [Linum tenue]